MAPATTNFVQPYSQEALEGEEGLTSKDLVKYLGVTHKNGVTKLKRNDWNCPEWLAPKAEDPNESNWLESIAFALITGAAKGFVTRGSSLIGDAYLIVSKFITLEKETIKNVEKKQISELSKEEKQTENKTFHIALVA